MWSRSFFTEIGSLYLSATNGHRDPETVIKVKRKPANGLKHIACNSMPVMEMRQEEVLRIDHVVLILPDPLYKENRLTINGDSQPASLCKIRLQLNRLRLGWRAYCAAPGAPYFRPRAPSWADWLGHGDTNYRRSGRPSHDRPGQRPSRRPGPMHRQIP